MYPLSLLFLLFPSLQLALSAAGRRVQTTVSNGALLPTAPAGVRQAVAVLAHAARPAASSLMRCSRSRGVSHQTGEDVSDSISAMTSRMHEPLRQSLATLKGSIIGNRAARAALVQHYPELATYAQWVFLSDHRSDRAVKGSCRCAHTAEALVQSLGRGQYRVLLHGDPPR